MTVAQLMNIVKKYGINPVSGNIDNDIWNKAVENNAHEYLRDISLLVVALGDSKVGS